jgi:hypothetical protein
MARGVFISYCFQDRDFAQRLVRDLKDGDIPVWFDEAELEPGDLIIGKIEAAIDRMDYLIVILSPASVSSGWVGRAPHGPAQRHCRQEIHRHSAAL